MSFAKLLKASQETLENHRRYSRGTPGRYAQLVRAEASDNYLKGLEAYVEPVRNEQALSIADRNLVLAL